MVVLCLCVCACIYEDHDQPKKDDASDGVPHFRDSRERVMMVDMDTEGKERKEK